MRESKRVPAIRFAGFTDPWEQRKFKDAIETSTEMVDPKSGLYDGLIHIGPGDMEPHTGQLIPDVKTVAESELISGKFHFYQGDVIYSKIRPELSKCVVAPAEGLASADAYVLRGKGDICQKFLYMLIQTKSFYDYSTSVSMRTGMPKINRDELGSYAFYAPSIPEQQKVGSALISLDHLITLHQRKYDHLVRVKKAMLEKMFPRNGANVPEIRFAGFTDPWEQRKLGEVGKARSGVGFPDTEQGGTSGIPFFKVSDMNNDGNENEMNVANNYVTDAQIAARRWSPIEEVPAIFFAKVGAAVMLNRKRLCRFPFLLDNNTMAYSLDKDQWDADFAKALFETVDLTSLVQVGALPSYNAGDVEAMEIMLPKVYEQRQIGIYFRQLDNLITLHQRKLEKLKKLKSAMLERMFPPAEQAGI